jgi:hypothetical protein
MTLCKKEKSFDLNGKWFRWTRYELKEGVVVPAITGELPTLHEYDPWESYRANVGRYRTVQQPYVAFLELQRELEELEPSRSFSSDLPPSHLPRGTSVDVNTEVDEAILRWCNQYGLLGLLSTLSNSICLPAGLTTPDRRDIRIVSQVVHFRDGGQWRSFKDVETVQGVSARRAETAARREARLRPKAGVNLLDRGSHTYQYKPLATIKDFFPHLWREAGAAGFKPPCPGEPESWADYGEPVVQIKIWCRLFARAVERLSEWRPNLTASDLAWDSIAVDRAFATLSGLTQSTVPSFRFNRNRNRMEEVRECAGLLGSYALMFLWDCQEGRRVLRCQKCGKYFVSNESRAMYCNISCRNTEQSRRFRASKKAKEASTAARTPQNAE